MLSPPGTPGESRAGPQGARRARAHIEIARNAMEMACLQAVLGIRLALLHTGTWACRLQFNTFFRSGYCRAELPAKSPRPPRFRARSKPNEQYHPGLLS